MYEAYLQTFRLGKKSPNQEITHHSVLNNVITKISKIVDIQTKSEHLVKAMGRTIAAVSVLSLFISRSKTSQVTEIIELSTQVCALKEDNTELSS